MGFTMLWKRVASAVTLACLSAGWAQGAPVEAKATLGPLQFAVVDLDLNDGIASGFSFLEGIDGPVGWSAMTVDTPRGSIPHAVSTDGFQRYPEFSSGGFGG